jgi:hypothetical protein
MVRLSRFDRQETRVGASRQGTSCCFSGGSCKLFKLLLNGAEELKIAALQHVTAIWQQTQAKIAHSEQTCASRSSYRAYNIMFIIDTPTLNPGGNPYPRYPRSTPTPAH